MSSTLRDEAAERWASLASVIEETDRQLQGSALNEPEYPSRRQLPVSPPRAPTTRDDYPRAPPHARRPDFKPLSHLDAVESTRRHYRQDPGRHAYGNESFAGQAAPAKENAVPHGRVKAASVSGVKPVLRGTCRIAFLASPHSLMCSGECRVTSLRGTRVACVMFWTRSLRGWLTARMSPSVTSHSNVHLFLSMWHSLRFEVNSRITAVEKMFTTVRGEVDRQGAELGSMSHQIHSVQRQVCGLSTPQPYHESKLTHLPLYSFKPSHRTCTRCSGTSTRPGTRCTRCVLPPACARVLF